MKVVNFYLGPAVGLASRTLTIRRMHRAGDDTLPAAAYGPADQGAAATTASITLADNTIWQATLVDVLASAGGTSETDVLNFHTGSLQFPGPRSQDRLQILSMEDLSSSSSSSSSPSSSSASSSSSKSTSTSSESSASSESSSSEGA